MKIFITGGTGFIGGAVVQRLHRAGHQLLVLVPGHRSVSIPKSRTQLLRGSLAQLNRLAPAISQFRPVVTIHLAWEGIPDFSVSMSAKNLVYSTRLIELVSQIKCPLFIGVGSCWEYGATQGRLSENLVPRPTNAFTAAKLSVQMFGEQVAQMSGTKFVWARLFYVYGPHQKPTSLIPSAIQATERGQVLPLKTPNAGNDFIYVDDVAEAIVQIVKRRASIKSGVYNVGSGKLWGVKQVMDLILRHFGIPGDKLAALPRPIGFYADTRKLTQATGWRPRTSLRQGIRQTINWYKSQ